MLTKTTPTPTPKPRPGTPRWYQAKIVALEEDLRLVTQGRDAALAKFKCIDDNSAPFIQRTRQQFGTLPEHINIYQAAEKWENAYRAEFNRVEREIQAAEALRRAKDASDKILADVHDALSDPWRPRLIGNLPRTVKDLGITWENLGIENRELKMLSSSLEAKNKKIEKELLVAQGAIEEMADQADHLRSEAADSLTNAWVSRAVIVLSLSYIVLHAMGVLR